MKRLNAKGFSMIELLVVLLIIGILAAVAAPLFSSNSDKAKISEAVAGLGSVRSGERTYYSQNSGYLAVTDGTTYFGTAGGNKSDVLGVQIHGVRYFSPKSFTVTVTSSWPSAITTACTAAKLTALGISAPQDFVILANGSAATNIALSSDATNGASFSGEAANYIVAMDNAGQVIYTPDGTNCSKF